MVNQLQHPKYINKKTATLQKEKGDNDQNLLKQKQQKKQKWGAEAKPITKTRKKMQNKIKGKKARKNTNGTKRYDKSYYGNLPLVFVFELELIIPSIF
jgi:hypothetical protein